MNSSTSIGGSPLGELRGDHDSTIRAVAATAIRDQATAHLDAESGKITPEQAFQM